MPTAPSLGRTARTNDMQARFKSRLTSAWRVNIVKSDASSILVHFRLEPQQRRRRKWPADPRLLPQARNESRNWPGARSVPHWDVRRDRTRSPPTVTPWAAKKARVRAVSCGVHRVVNRSDDAGRGLRTVVVAAPASTDEDAARFLRRCGSGRRASRVQGGSPRCARRRGCGPTFGPWTATPSSAATCATGRPAATRFTSGSRNWTDHCQPRNLRCREWR